MKFTRCVPDFCIFQENPAKTAYFLTYLNINFCEETEKLTTVKLTYLLFCLQNLILVC